MGNVARGQHAAPQGNRTALHCGGPHAAPRATLRSRGRLSIASIHLIITTPAGSLVDVLGRLFAEEIGSRIGQPIVVDNRPGAMTQVGTEALLRADPDGYTLMMGTSELTMLPFLKKGYRYDPTRDIVPIALVTTSWTVFAIYPGLPPRTLPEFISYAKANPGKLRYGSGGVGGALHIAVEMLKLKTGIDLIHVPLSRRRTSRDRRHGRADRNGVDGAGERPRR